MTESTVNSIIFYPYFSLIATERCASCSAWEIFTRTSVICILYVSLNFQNFVSHDSGRHFNLYHVTCVSTHKCFSNRRFIGDFSLKAVCFCGTYDFQFDVFFKFKIVYFYFTSNADLVEVNFILYYNFCVL